MAAGQRQSSRSIAGYVMAVLATSAGTSIIAGIDHLVQIPNVSLLYLPAILFVAVYFGTVASLLAATLAVLEYDFFLLQPIFTFTIRQVEDILAFGVFVIVAVLTSQLAARARQRAEAAQRRATESTMLYELGQALMSAHAVPQVLKAITERIVAVFGVDRCAIFVPDADGRPTLAAETPTGGVRDRAARATASWVLQRGTQVGLPTGNPRAFDEQRIYVPLRTSDRTVGVMEVGRKQGQALDGDERRLVTSFAAQAALVIAQAQNEEARYRLQVVEESDRLKSALLNAVSHDLRTPLASIKASATALLLADASWTAEQGREFLEAIDHEADRLNRLVGNLLDLSRIEAGVLRPALEWYDVSEMMNAILPVVEPLVHGRHLTIDVEPGDGPVQLDLVRIQELVVNLVDNAVKYTPANSPIELRIARMPRGLSLAIVDHGPGVAMGRRERIFDTFYRGQQHSDRHPGTGLGLAICRGIAEAHGGAITVEDTPGGGATFILTVPSSTIGEHLPV